MSLSYLNEQEGVIKLQRLNEYPPVKITLISKTIWVPIAHWLEERPETLAMYRIQSNLGEIVNPNLYFFANHPNERVGIDEHEGFPYLLLPLFVIGLFSFNFRKNFTAISASLFAPIFLTAGAGLQIGVEPISLFPFISLCSVLGIENVWEKVAKLKSQNLKILIIFLFISLYLLTFLQVYLYDRY